jgi:hypothetical protein
LFWILLKFGLRNTTGLRKWLLRLKHDFCFTSARRSNEQTCFPPFFQKEMAARALLPPTRAKSITTQAAWMRVILLAGNK